MILKISHLLLYLAVVLGQQQRQARDDRMNWCQKQNLYEPCKNGEGTLMHRGGSKNCRQACVKNPSFYRLFLWRCRSCSKYKCFASKDELQNAVDLYIKDDSVVREKYGDPIGTWCVKYVTDFSYLFESWQNYNEDISKWDVSSATSMRNMFFDAQTFNQDISRWDVSKVTNMRGMFANADAFNQNITRWDVAKVKEMGLMFTSTLLFNQDLSNWDVSSVTDTTNMFEATESFNQDISKWMFPVSRI